MLNGHDPAPGDWHPDDVASAWIRASTDQTDAVGEDGPQGADVQRAGSRPAGPGIVRLDSIEDTSPPPPLLGWIAPEPGSITIVSGDGGSGKGTFAAWLCATLTRTGGSVLVIDAEGHPREWRRRVADLGGDAAAVAYWEHPGGDLELDDYSGLFDLVIVDSAAYFWPDGERWADAPVRMQQQAKVAGVPLLVIAHKPKGGGTHAYGSVFWANAARLHVEMADSALVVRKVNDLMGLEKGDRWEVELEKDDRGRIVRYSVRPDDGHEGDVDRRLREYLASWRSKDDVAQHMGWGKRTAQQHLNRMLGVEVMQQDHQSPRLWRVAASD